MLDSGQNSKEKMLYDAYLAVRGINHAGRKQEATDLRINFEASTLRCINETNSEDDSDSFTA